MTVVLLGHEDGQITTIPTLPDAGDLPMGWTEEERMRVITDRGAAGSGIWDTHKVHSGTDRPAWVESDDYELAEKLAKHFGCPVGRPAEEAAS